VKPPPRLGGLDGLRGIAALMVVGLHTQAVFDMWPGWFDKGYLSVDFFLMLSGYLMARSVEPKLAGGASPAAFMLARYRRFWPMMALGTLIGAPYLWARTHGLGQFAPVLAANLALLPAPFAGVLFAANIPAWYVFFELVINAIHVFALRHLPRWALAGLALALLLATAWTARDYGLLDVGARPDNFWHAFPRVALAYTLGMLMARTQGAGRPVPLPGWLAPAVIPAAMFASHALLWADWTFDLAFVMVACPLAIQSALNQPRASGLAAISAAVSFPLYATNLPVMEGMRELGFGWHPALAMALTTALAITWWTNRPTRRMALANR
jgi:peptidoglycan/LPS O-acetylase OafA/YrhL